MIERYNTDEMERIWGREGEIDRLITASLASARLTGGEELEGAVWDFFDSHSRGEIDRSWRYYEERHDHDIAAWVAMVRADLPPVNAWHRGRTSSDLVETALGIGIQHSVFTVLLAANKLAAQVATLALEHQSTHVVGRTHGRHAELTTIGRRFALLAHSIDKTSKTVDPYNRGKMSGPVGVSSTEADEIKALQGTGLVPTWATQVVPRWRLARTLHDLARYSLALTDLATEIRLGSQSGISIYAERSPSADARGSSAMPHKRNPIRSERAVGLCRLIRTNAYAAVEAGTGLWNERDISHSSVERLALVDAFTLAHFVTVDLTGVVKRLEVDTVKASVGVRLPSGQASLEALLDAGWSYDEAYARVRELGSRAYLDQTDKPAIRWYDPTRDRGLWSVVRRIAAG